MTGPCCVEDCPEVDGPEAWKAWGWMTVTNNDGRSLRFCHQHVPVLIRREFSRNRPEQSDETR